MKRININRHILPIVVAALVMLVAFASCAASLLAGRTRIGHSERRRRKKPFLGRRELLMFYEPDCDQCLDAEKRLAESAAFNRLVATGELQMLAVYVGHDRRLWSEHAAKLPASWIVGIDAAMKIDGEDLYHIGATPSFYLIDAEGTVMVKDAAFPAVANALRL